jgi:sulfhydrogenase subunit beta (sulfur reductase)
MKGYYLSQENVKDFILHLMKKRTVYAPHAKADHSFVFEEVVDADNVILDYLRTLNSIKKYFMPSREVMLRYNLDDNSYSIEDIEPVKGIFLGVHSYDMQAVLRLDHSFSHGNPEKNYLTRRLDNLFIGTSFTPDNFHFSSSVNIHPHKTEGFDLFMHKTDRGYVLEEVTKTGSDLMKGFDQLTKFHGEYPNSEHFKSHLYAPQEKLSNVFDESYDNLVWHEMAQKCVGCGTCNLVCPTCYCFDMEDHVDLSLQSGIRERRLDSCMLRGFTEVAGGEVFRNRLADRIRHRVYRKFKYISDAAGEPWCVGCGRCTIYCTAGISIVDIVNRLVSDYDKKQIVQDSDMIAAWD